MIKDLAPSLHSPMLASAVQTIQLQVAVVTLQCNKVTDSMNGTNSAIHSSSGEHQ
jgi:hypothetical protein